MLLSQLKEDVNPAELPPQTVPAPTPTPKRAVERVTGHERNVHDITLLGMPCLCRVDVEPKFYPGKYSGPWEDSYPDDSDPLEYTLFDRKGYRAGWLEKKSTPEQVEQALEDAGVTFGSASKYDDYDGPDDYDDRY